MNCENILRSLVVRCLLFCCICGCSKHSDPPSTPSQKPLEIKRITLNGTAVGDHERVDTAAVIVVELNRPVDPGTTASAVSMVNQDGVAVPLAVSTRDSSVTVRPATPLAFLKSYRLSISTALKSTSGDALRTAGTLAFATRLDTVDKFPRITDDSLLSLVQRQTFHYFWDFGHPVSGLARERDASGETVTTGGSGFGIMAIPVAIERGFISRQEGVARLQKIVAFLASNASRFHGAFSHWLNGTSGAVIPFSQQDNGADIVETSYLMMGLLTARQYFDQGDAAESTLRADINALWNAVEWDWFTQSGKSVLYWHWSPTDGWALNVPVQGWNETLITYVLAGSSTTHPVPRAAYDSGFARNGAMKNGSSYYGYLLPLGEAMGGPLFFEHYSFLGIDPRGLSDAYANYQTQTLNHTLINYEYCKANPLHYYGYGADCWGLTASDVPGGYDASSPTHDLGVIAPTAAIASLPYTPTESLNALRFYYYKLGDHLWSNYGFFDAFDLDRGWFSNSYLAIDEGPIVVMIENYRTQLLWHLLTSAPEIRAGLVHLGFSAPYL